MHKIDHDHDKQYEELIITSGFVPLISLYTHMKPDCRKTCIDNILTNNPDFVSLSGSIRESMSRSHHLPIFHISRLNNVDHDNNSSSNNNMQYYDFCNSNIDQFVTTLGSTFTALNDDMDFTAFTTTYNTVLDDICKLKVPKRTKRNRKANPWITDGIIASVKTKSILYKAWNKSKSSKNPTGDADKYRKFSDYRKNLKRIIKCAKSKYYYKKIYEHDGDMKKHGRSSTSFEANVKTPSSHSS